MYLSLFYISITCKTLRVSVFNKELLYNAFLSGDLAWRYDKRKTAEILNNQIIAFAQQ